jgi:2-octaprenyl-3-methyl-6-methoxy-1,4-benzoquinol hydroxylase/2-octaprenylphenol hydroxylase
VGAAVRDAQFGESSAQLTLDNGQAFSARLVIAAEGRQSPLRELAGIDCQQWDYPQQAIVCNVTTEQPHAKTAWQRFLPDGPLAFLPLADGRSSIVWSTRQAQTLMSLNDTDFMAQLGESLQHRLARIMATTRRVSFPLGLLHAREMVRPRLALAGDAAHVVHPLAGQGVNLGLADAAALIEVVTAALAQRRDPGQLRVLQRYARARKADTLDMLAVTEGLYRAYGTGLSGWSELRQLGLDAANRLPLFKNLLMRRAMGF